MSGFDGLIVPAYMLDLAGAALLPRGWKSMTDEQRADYLAEVRRKKREAKARLKAFRGLVAACTTPIARAVFDLHVENATGECEGCDYGGWEGEPPDWPCRTVLLAASLVGIESP